MSKEIIETLVQYLQTGAGKIGVVEQRILVIETDVQRHARLLTDGNGTPALVVQIAAIETRLKAMEEKLKKVEDSRIQLRNALIALSGVFLMAMATILAAWIKGK